MTTPKIKIAILDDYANISTPYFHPLCQTHNLDLTVFTTPFPSVSPSTLTPLLQPYTIISTMRERTPLPRSLLTALPNLRLILTTGTRNAGIDVAACRDLNILVAGTGGKPGGVPGHSDTNEQTWALILGLAKNIAVDDRRLKFRPDAEWQNGLVVGLAGKTLGLMGFGRLGVQCAVTGVLGFGMRAVAWSSSLTQAKADEVVVGRGLPAGTVRVVARKEELFQEADVLSIHYVLSERSRGMVGREELGWMKKTALLVNTSRGPLVDEAALLETLREGRVRGAALDVFETEPLPADSPWRSQEWGMNGRSHVLLSPHTGYIEEETMNYWYRQNAEDLQRWLKGEELSIVLK